MLHIQQRMCNERYTTNIHVYNYIPTYIYRDMNMNKEVKR